MATRPLGVEVPGVAMALRRPGAWAIVARDPFVVNGIYNRVELKPFLRVFPEAPASQ